MSAKTAAETAAPAKKTSTAQTKQPALFALFGPRFFVTLAIVVFVASLITRNSSSLSDIVPDTSVSSLFSGPKEHPAEDDELENPTLYTAGIEQPIYPSTLPLGVVVAQKANLRSGPAKIFAPIMMVSKGTRLAIKKKGEEWVNVIAPSGEEAWIMASSLVIPGK